METKRGLDMSPERMKIELLREWWQQKEKKKMKTKNYGWNIGNCNLEGENSGMDHNID